MSLNWSIENVRDKDDLWIEITEQEYTQPPPLSTVSKRDGKFIRLNWKTTILIWVSMSLGLGKITEKNVNKWVERLAWLQKVDGAMLGDHEQSYYVTRSDVERNIGLSMNVVDETGAAWRKKFMTNRSSEMAKWLDRMEKEQGKVLEEREDDEEETKDSQAC
jgi:hypothetical protein